MSYAKELKKKDQDFFSKLKSVHRGFTTPDGQESKCWEWTGTCFKNGYGRVYEKDLAPGETKAHRYSFILAKGKIGKGKVGKHKGKSLYILHKCDNRVCCNPNHLYASDHRQNMVDMVMRDRSAKGETHGNSIMVNPEVAFLKLLIDVGFSYRVISEMTLIPKSTAARFVSDKAWYHVPAMIQKKAIISSYVQERRDKNIPLRRPDMSGITASNAQNALVPVGWIRQCVAIFGQVRTAEMLKSTRKKIRMILEKPDNAMLSVNPKTSEFVPVELDKKAKVREFILKEIAT